MIGAVTTFTPRRPGLQSRLWREAARLFFKHVVNPTLPVEVRRRRLERMTRFNWLPSGTRVEPVVAGGVPAEWVVPRTVNSESVLLYLHGGGYAIGSPASHRMLVSHLAQAAGMRALVPHYRLAPEHH